MITFLSRPRSTSADLNKQILQKPSNIKGVGLLTHIFGKRATRRCSWCNSQLLSPSGRGDMSETMIPLTVRWLARVATFRSEKMFTIPGGNSFVILACFKWVNCASNGGLNKSFSKTPHQKPHLQETFRKPSGKLPGSEPFWDTPRSVLRRSMTLYNHSSMLYKQSMMLYNVLQTFYDAPQRFTNTL